MKLVKIDQLMFSSKLHDGIAPTGFILMCVVLCHKKYFDPISLKV